MDLVFDYCSLLHSSRGHFYGVNLSYDAKVLWLEWLRKHLGETEWTGKLASEFVKHCFSYTTFGDDFTITPPCCAATICAALEECGYRSTRSAAAISYKDYGLPSMLIPGAICVFEWAPRENHVSVYEAPYDVKHGIFLGGNQGHYLQRSVFPYANVISERWPVLKTI